MERRRVPRPEIIAIHNDGYHPGDEIQQFAFRDEMGKIVQNLDVGKNYCVEYSPPLETARGKKIVRATGILANIEGYFGLKNATIYYLDSSSIEKDLIIGLISGMKLTQLES